MKYRQHNPLIPMGAITGHPSREELREMLEQYRKNGIDQFLIYPRSGLEVEYMGCEWLEICRHIIEYCAEYDMAVWLYDEYNWPSGKCRGKVVRSNPDFSSKKLVAFADRNFCGVESPDAAASEYFWAEMSIPLYADLLNPDAVDCFIELTHEVYCHNFKSYFGSTIKGIFSDEPSFMYAQLQPVQGSAIEIPYYIGMKEDYLAATGCDLIQDMESYLAGKGRHGLWFDFYNLLGKRFCREYLGKIKQWCDGHDLIFTGHLMSESYPQSAINASGRPVDAIRSFSMPGIDEILSRTKFEEIEWNTLKLLESAICDSRIDGLAELFALGPSDMTFTRMRYLIYLMATHGVNHFVTAISAFDAKGCLEKAYYFNPISPTQPWFSYIAGLNDTAVIAAGLTRKVSNQAIALRYPQRLFCEKWCHPKKPQLKIDYTELIHALVGAQWEFRIIGDDDPRPANCTAILVMNQDGIYEELSEKQFHDSDQLLKFLEHTSRRRATLLHENGQIVKNVFLKNYDDGTRCLINTSGNYLYNVILEGEQLDLYPEEVVIFPRRTQTFSNTLNLNHHIFSVERENRNTLRPIFISSSDAQLNVSSDTNVVIALRQYGGNVNLSLNDIPLHGIKPCSVLPVGYKNLYLETAEILLSPGRHILSLTNSAMDIPYLPAAVVTGDFAMDQNKILKSFPRSNSIAGAFSPFLQQYSGSVRFTDNFDLTGYDSITVEHNNLCVELFLDDKSLGSRLWPPFIWKIPPELQHKGVIVTVRVTTSIGPLFADFPNHAPEGFPTWMAEFWPGITK